MNNRQRRQSKKRDLIFNIIRSTDTHPGASWIYGQLKPKIPDLSLGTVYRNIRIFIRDGTLAFVGVFNGEERFDAVVNPHPHIVCSGCGSVADLPCPSKSAIKRLEGNYRGTAAIGSRVIRDSRAVKRNEEKFTIDYRKTIFSGLCADCSKA